MRALRSRSAALRRLVTPLIEWVKRRELPVPFGEARGLRLCAEGGTLGYLLGLEEPLVQRALRAHLRPGATFFDLGANVGFFALIGARLVGDGGKVYAFEPVPETAARLRANAARNRFRHVHVLEHAVSDQVGSATFVVGPITQMARLGDSQHAADPAERRLEVSLTRIDDLVEQGAVSPPHFVMLDVEGAEVAALKGMSETLRRYRPIVLCELHGTHLEVAALLRAHGYVLTVLEAAVPVEEAPAYAHLLAAPAPIQAGLA